MWQNMHRNTISPNSLAKFVREMRVKFCLLQTLVGSVTTRPFKETMTEWPIDRPSDTPGQREVTAPKSWIISKYPKSVFLCWIKRTCLLLLVFSLFLYECRNVQWDRSLLSSEDDLDRAGIDRAEVFGSNVTTVGFLCE